jgi:hypothetical protein
MYILFMLQSKMYLKEAFSVLRLLCLIDLKVVVRVNLCYTSSVIVRNCWISLVNMSMIFAVNNNETFVVRS